MTSKNGVREVIRFGLMLLPQLLGAQGAQVIRGRVTSDSGVAILAADVIVTIAPSAETIVTATDPRGDYRVEIPAPRATGEYLLYIAAPGRRPFRQRIGPSRGDSVVVVDAKLASVIVTVAAVHVEARRPRPGRSFGSDNGVVSVADGLNRTVDGVVNALPPELQGDFAAMASLIPGLAVTSNGVSAFGLGPDANRTTLNGMSFGGGSVPRDLAMSTTYLTSPWDPTRGGFSGALASATVLRGGNIGNRRARISVDAPAMQGGDPLGARFGQRYANVQLSHASSGALALDKLFYNYGIQGYRQTASVGSLIDLDPIALERAGVSADSARRLTQLLASRSVPLTVGGIPGQRVTTSAQFVGRFDLSQPPSSAAARPPAGWQLLVGADRTVSEAPSLAPTEFPAASGRTTNGGGFVQGVYSRYFGALDDYVNETAGGFSYRRSSSSPYLALPGGRVSLVSTLSDASAALGTLSFGGNSALAADMSTVSWEVDNQTNFFFGHRPSLPAKLYFQLRHEHYEQSIPTDRLGTFSFSSLDAVERNAPTSFSRVLNSPDRSGGEWLGAAAIGGSWSTTRLVLSGGVRADANLFTGLPAANPLLASTFDVRNDQGPRSVAVSPRLGFNWYPTAQTGPAIYFSPVSNSYRAGYQIRGGIGEFRNFLPPALLSGAMGTTGLPGSTRQLVCTGPEAPTPDWPAYLADPSRSPANCASGATTFADSAPAVELVDPSYAPSRTWRGTIGWTNTIQNNYLAIDAVYSSSLDQPGVVDLNFGGVPRFTLPDEGNRPVFVSPSSVVASTGSSSAVESRRSALFGRVLERLSDLRGETRQITVYGIPNIPFRLGVLTLGYTYSDAHAQSRGFDGAAGADPRAVEWGPQAFTPRHQFVVQGARAFHGGAVALTFAARAMSGLRYTPLVAGDVNGDGMSGDRAFIFDPSRVADASLARGLQELLDHGSGSARDCLARQINTIATRNSCIGPWTATMNASLFMPQVPWTNGRVQASLNLSNPLGGLDQLLHGSGGLRGWGSAPVIDGTLYRVQRFDPDSQRFVYQVNPRFGSPMAGATTFRSPFRVTLDVRLDYGPSAEEQRLEQNLRIKPSLVGTRAPADSIRNRYVASSFVGLYSHCCAWVIPWRSLGNSRSSSSRRTSCSFPGSTRSTTRSRCTSPRFLSATS
jgi:hypothetical protein